MRELPELHALYQERQAEASALHGHWREIARLTDDKLWVASPSDDEVAQAAVPDIISQGIDSYARRFASVQPDVDCAPLRPNISSSVRRAVERAEVIGEWWRASHMGIADYQAGRFFFAYGAMPKIIRSDHEQPGVPRWEALNPMSVLPGPRELGYSPVVPDAFRSASRSAKWVRETYGVDFGPKVRPDALVEIVEYIDAEQITVFCVGPASPVMPSWSSGVSPGPYGEYGGYWSERGTHVERITGGGAAKPWVVLLSSSPNYAGRCTVVYPGAVSLSRQKGLVDGIIGKFKVQAKFMDLWMRGIARGIYPEQWASLDPDRGGRVVREANGRKGITGIIEGGTVQMLQVNPGYQTGPFIDRLESYMRSEAGISPEFGGESGSNIRTGRRGGQVLDETVEPVLAEAHTLAQIAKEEEIKIAVAVAKGYGGSRPRSIYVGTSGKRARREYVATELFETDEATVRYAVVGADMSQLLIAAGQSIGTGMMSKRLARQLNPLVPDVHADEVQIDVEALEDGLRGMLAASLAERSPADVAWMIRQRQAGKSLSEVIEGADERARERQASAGPVGAPDGPVAPGSPEAQPGIGLPGGGAEAPSAPGPMSLRDVANLFTNTRIPTRTVPAERGA